MKGLNHPNIGKGRTGAGMGEALGREGGTVLETWPPWCSHFCVAEVPWASTLFSGVRVCSKVVMTG